MKKESGKIIIKISFIWLFVSAILVLSTISFFRSEIFATNRDEFDVQENNITIEQNENEIDILSLMVENNYENRKLINEERDINFETEVQKKDKLPKGEETIHQVGVIGKKQVTALQTYQENNFMGHFHLQIK